jgi:hypothetical protein
VGGIFYWWIRRHSFLISIIEYFFRDFIFIPRRRIKMNHNRFALEFVVIAVFISILLFLSPSTIGAQENEPQAPANPNSTVGTAFTYQGRLTDGGAPANGNYEFRFYLWAEEGKTTLLGTYTASGTIAIDVVDGYFTTTLDFGVGIFDGNERWLEIEVNGSLLAPLQPITPAPYAIYAQHAPWDGLTNVPAGFADGTDDGLESVTWLDILNRPSGLDDGDQDTTYSPGYGLGLDTTTFNVMTDTIQTRVTGVCGTGYAIRQVNPDGSVVCEQDDGEAYYSGYGLSLVGTTFSVMTNTIQTRVSGYCEVGSTIRVVNADGTVICDMDDNTTYTPGYGLDLTAGEFSVDTNEVQDRVDGACPSGQSIRVVNQDGTVVCETDDDTDTTYTAGTGLDLVGTEFSVDSTEVQDRVYGTCPAGQSIRTIHEDGSVTCETDDDSDTTYTAGTGLDLVGTEFSVLTDTIQTRISEVCGSGYAIRQVNQDGSVVCEEDNYRTYNAGTGLNYIGTQWFGFFSVDFDGSGSATTVARSDHDHNGEYWSLTGNSGTTPGTHYLGTTDTVSLTLVVSDTAALRIEPASDFIGRYSPNLIGGYSGNRVTPGVVGATIGGGGRELETNHVTDDFGTVGGGGGNIAGNNDGATMNQRNATVGGGSDNRATSYCATIGGGRENRATGQYATIGGGELNEATDGGTTVGGGNSNHATAWGATVPGGNSNRADGMLSFAAGYRAVATGYANGSFVWSDFNEFDTTSYAPNQFLVRATGGFWFGTGINDNGYWISGVSLPSGSSQWSQLSDREMKMDLKPVDVQEVAAKVASLPLQTWSYKAQSNDIRHMGPMAQDFYEVFGLGEDERYIGTMNADGVALAAIQGLYAISQEQAEEIEDLQVENASLRKQLSGGIPGGVAHHLSILVYVLAGVVLLLLAGFIWILVRFRSLLPSEASHVR